MSVATAAPDQDGAHGAEEEPQGEARERPDHGDGCLIRRRLRYLLHLGQAADRHEQDVFDHGAPASGHEAMGQLVHEHRTEDSDDPQQAVPELREVAAQRHQRNEEQKGPVEADVYPEDPSNADRASCPGRLRHRSCFLDSGDPEASMGLLGLRRLPACA